MAAVRWFLFALVAFGGGAIVGFALHPPTIGIPQSSAADLRTRLGKIERYAKAGRCEAVKGQLSGAQSTIDKLPEDTAVTVQQQLQDAVAKVRREALATCLIVDGAKTNSAQAQADPLIGTTPEATPTPAPTPTAPPVVTPTPAAPDSGTTTPSTGGSDGGVTIPPGDAGAALRQGIDEARGKYREERERVERALDQLSQELGQ